MELSLAVIRQLDPVIKGDFLRDRTEVDKFEVSLDADPSKKSPEALYRKLHMAREYANRTSTLYLKYLKAYITLNQYVEWKEYELKRRVSALLYDRRDEFKSVRSLDEKVRMAEALVEKDLVDEVSEGKRSLSIVKGYHQFFKVKHELMTSTKDDILTQLGILKTMIQMGALPILGSDSPVLEQTPEQALESLKTEGEQSF